jgi:hypothetical protein
MLYEKNGFTFELIDEPKQRHVVAFEKTSRALKNEDAKPALTRAFDELKKINVTESKPATLVAAYNIVSDALQSAIEVLKNNETLTVSANRGVMVKAAITSGWIVAPVMTYEQVDELTPWKVAWMAEQIATSYLGVTSIPKN